MQYRPYDPIAPLHVAAPRPGDGWSGVGGAALSAAGTIAGGNSAAAMGRRMAGEATFEAAQDRLNASSDIAASQRRMIDTQQKTNLLIGSATARAGASGINAGVGWRPRTSARSGRRAAMPRHSIFGTARTPRPEIWTRRRRRLSEHARQDRGKRSADGRDVFGARHARRRRQLSVQAVQPTGDTKCGTGQLQSKYPVGFVVSRPMTDFAPLTESLRTIARTIARLALQARLRETARMAARTDLEGGDGPARVELYTRALADVCTMLDQAVTVCTIDHAERQGLIDVWIRTEARFLALPIPPARAAREVTRPRAWAPALYRALDAPLDALRNR